jgi:DNA polymerase III epsilon subunit-like protein
MLDSLVHPQRSIPSQVTRIHGISNQAIREAPTFADLLPELIDCFSGVTHLVAHNISFDIGFLRAELSGCGVEMPHSFEDRLIDPGALGEIESALAAVVETVSSVSVDVSIQTRTGTAS